MSVDPDPINERQRTVSRSELKMDDMESLESQANVDSAIEDFLNDE